MFQKYDVNKLYLAVITVKHSKDINDKLSDHKKILMPLSSESKYSYETIIYDNNGTYIDLRRMKVISGFVTVKIVGPLSNYYMQDGKRIVTRKESIESAKLIHDYLNRKRMKY